MILKRFVTIALSLLLLTPVLSAQSESELVSDSKTREVTRSAGVGLDMALYSKNGYESVAPGHFAGITGFKGVDGRFIGFYQWAIPLTGGIHRLSEQAGLAVKFSGELSPVHMQARGDIAYTFVPFFVLHNGVYVGTGWSLGNFAMGLGLNGPNGYDTSAFQGAVFDTHFGAKLQFDFGAVFPGDWTHLAIVADHAFEYHSFTAARADTPWRYVNDSGRNVNGWFWTGSYYLVYSMPLPLSAVGGMVELTQNVGDAAAQSPMARGWGSDALLIKTGPLLNFKFGDHNTLTAIFQFKRDVTWHENEASTVLMNRTFRGYYWGFHRLALVYRYNF